MVPKNPTVSHQHFPTKLPLFPTLNIHPPLQLHPKTMGPVLIRPIQSVHKPGRCWCCLVRKPGLCGVAINGDTRGAILHSQLQLLAAQLTLEEPTLYMYGQDLYLGQKRREYTLDAGRKTIGKLQNPLKERISRTIFLYANHLEMQPSFPVLDLEGPFCWYMSNIPSHFRQGEPQPKNRTAQTSADAITKPFTTQFPCNKMMGPPKPCRVKLYAKTA